MNIGKNLRTKISTIVAVGAYLNMLLATFDPSIFADDPTAMKVYQIVSAILALCAWANSHYYNQDFTPEAVTATITMRDAKRKRLLDVEKAEEPKDSYLEEEEIEAEEYIEEDCEVDENGND